MSKCAESCGCVSSGGGSELEPVTVDADIPRHGSSAAVRGGGDDHGDDHDDDDVMYLQSLTEKEHAQRRAVVENLAYKTALEELAGERYGEAYFAAQRRGWKEGEEDAGRVVAALLRAGTTTSTRS